jgi:tyrosyl-tRNA synthetase
LLRLVVWPRLAQLHKDGPERFEIHRPEKFGGNKLYVGYDAVLAEYRSGALHPMDLKNGVADALITLLQPVRDYFAKNPENVQFVQGLRKTR